MINKRSHIEVTPYNLDWEKQFKEAASQIKEALGDNFLAIHHVGSTSVPGLAAKPKIDIIAVVKELEKSIPQLESVGFDYRGEYNIPMHYGFSKRGPVNINLHVYTDNHPEIELNLTFRDYLRNHPETRDAYAALKLELLKNEASFEKNRSLFTGYNLGKNSFIHRVLKEAGFNRLRFVICTHYSEWEFAKHFRQKDFFDHQDHIHFILYKGVEVIGYAHIQLWPESRAAIRILVIDAKKRKQGFGGQFLSWIEGWLKAKGYRSIHTESSPNSIQFYRNQGYTEIPFDNPDGHASDAKDRPMGKILLHQR